MDNTLILSEIQEGKFFKNNIIFSLPTIPLDFYNWFSFSLIQIDYIYLFITLKL